MKIRAENGGGGLKKVNKRRKNEKKVGKKRGKNKKLKKQCKKAYKIAHCFSILTWVLK
jgi:hypothetical protein